MTSDFQLSILRFILQAPEGARYAGLLDPTLFDGAHYQVASEAAQKLIAQYGSQPSKGVFTEYIRRQLASTPGLTAQDSQFLLEFTGSLYTPEAGSAEFVKETLLGFAQHRHAKRFVKDFSAMLAGKSLDGIEPNALSFLQAQARVIGGLKTFIERPPDFGDLLQNPQLFNPDHARGYPGPFRGMNQLMTVKGFHGGSLGVIMSGPKAGKTTLLVNMTIGFLRAGIKCLYWDTENGFDRISRMLFQCMTQSTEAEMLSNDWLRHGRRIVERYAALGAGLRVHSVPPKCSSMSDIQLYLDELESVHDFVPEFIMFDHLDNMNPVQKNPQQDNRLSLQAVYTDAKKLLTERDIFGFTPSQVNRDGIRRLQNPMSRLSINELAEDIGKAGIANSIWVYHPSRDENGELLGVGRLYPAVNRDGKDYGTVNLMIQPELCLIQESEYAIDYSHLMYAN